MKAKFYYLITAIFLLVTVLSCNKRNRLKGDSDLFVGEWKEVMNIEWKGSTRGGGCRLDTTYTQEDVILTIRKRGKAILERNGEKKRYNLTTSDKFDDDDSFRYTKKFSLNCQDTYTTEEYYFKSISFTLPHAEREDDVFCAINENSLITVTTTKEPIINHNNPGSPWYSNYRFWQRID